MAPVGGAHDAEVDPQEGPEVRKMQVRQVFLGCLLSMLSNTRQTTFQSTSDSEMYSAVPVQCITQVLRLTNPATKAATI